MKTDNWPDPTLSDPKFWIPILTGTILRGLMWAAGTVCVWLGIDPPEAATWEAPAAWAAAAVFVGAAVVWSIIKDKWLYKLWPSDVPH